MARGQPKLFRETLEIPGERKLGAQPRLPGIAERTPPSRIADESLQRGGECHRVRFAYQHAGVVADQLRNRRDARRQARESLALRLGKHVRQAVAIAIARDAASERKEIRLAVLRQQLLLRERPAPGNALTDAEAARLLLQPLL